MPANPKDVVRQWFEEVWNRKDAAAIDRIADPACVIHGLGEGGADPGALADFRTFHASFCSAYPDMRVVVHELVAEGELVAWRISFAGTHSGPGLQVAATGLRVDVGGIGISRVRGGRIVEGWNEFDRLGMMKQLRVL